MKLVLRLAGMAAATVLLVAAGCGRSPGGRTKGWTALHTAANAGDLTRARRLLHADPALLDADDGDGHTPLHVAADQGRDAVAACLLDAGASLEAQDSCGWTPLHMAASKGHAAVVALLLARGARVNAGDRRQQTPLDLALKWHHTDVAELLRAHGGQP